MRFLKFLLLLIVGLIILALTLGLVKKSVSYGHEISVDKPVAEAWEVMKDESKFSQWLEGYKSIELLSGEQDAIGSTYKVIVNPGDGQPDFEMIQTLVAMKEHEMVELHYSSEMMDFEQITSFSENGGKTSVKTASEVKGKGLIMRSMFAMMEMLTGSFTKQEAKNVEALKKLINENTTVYNTQ